MAEKLTPFDLVVTDEKLQTLKLLLPYVPSEYQSFLGISSFLHSDELIGVGIVSVVNGRERCFDSFPLQVLCATELVQGRIEVTELRIDPA